MSMYEQDKAQSIGEGIEMIKKGLDVIDDYDLLLVFEETDSITKDEMIEAITLIKNGFNMIDKNWILLRNTYWHILFNVL